MRRIALILVASALLSACSDKGGNASLSLLAEAGKSTGNPSAPVPDSAHQETPTELSCLVHGLDTLVDSPKNPQNALITSELRMTFDVPTGTNLTFRLRSIKWDDQPKYFTSKNGNQVTFISRSLRAGGLYTLDTFLDDKSSALPTLTISVRQKGVVSAFETDFDGDGEQDTLVFPAQGPMAILAKDGGKRFVPLMAQRGFLAARLADFNADGRPDVVTIATTSHGGLGLTLHLNTSTNGILSLEESKSFDFGTWLIPTGLSVLDLSRDGDLDLVVSTMQGDLLLLEHHQSRDFDRFESTLIRPRSISAPILSMGVGLYADGLLPDLLLTYADGIFLLRGSKASPGVEAGMESLIPLSSRPLRVEREALYSRSPLLMASVGRLVYEVQRDGLQFDYQDPVAILDGAIEAMAACTVAGDHATLVISSHPDGLQVNLMARVDGSYHPLREWQIDAARDLNALEFGEDGTLALLATDLGLIRIPLLAEKSRPSLSLDSRMLFAETKVVGLLPQFLAQQLADLDRDGHPEVIGIFEREGRIILGVWHNGIADGTGLIPLDEHVLEGSSRMILLDANRDHLPDLLIIPHAGDQSTSLFIGDGSGRLGEPDQSYLLQAPSNVLGEPIVADFNGDSTLDMFWPTTRGALSFATHWNMHASRDFDPTLDEFGTLELRLTGKAIPFTPRNDGYTGVVAATATDRGEHRLVFYRNRTGYGSQIGDFVPQTLQGQFRDISWIGAIRSPVSSSGMTLAAVVRKAEGWTIALWDDLHSGPRLLDEVGFLTLAPESLSVVDIDLDGDDDLVYVAENSLGQFELLVNAGDASFLSESISAQSLRTSKAGESIRQAHLVDLNGDGTPDFLAFGNSGRAWHSASSK